jgi:hypothetical protein
MTSYEQLAVTSKVWVFQAEREFTKQEEQLLSDKLNSFVDNWLSHGSLVKGHFKLLHNRFIVFFADEQGEAICGRAVDASVRFIKEMEAQLGIAMLNRSLVAYLDNGKVISCTLNDLSALLEEGKINQDTSMFNNLVASKEDFEKNWVTPLSASWHQNYILQNK